MADLPIPIPLAGAVSTGWSREFSRSRTNTQRTSGTIHFTRTAKHSWIRQVHDNIYESRSLTAVTYNFGHVFHQISVGLEGVFLWMFHVMIDTRARRTFQTLLHHNRKLDVHVQPTHRDCWC